MAFRYLIYSTGTTYADTIVRSSAVDDPGVNEASLFSDFVIPEIQPLYLWRVTGGTEVVPNIDQNIENYLNTIIPISPDDYLTYGIYTGFTAQTSSDIAYISGVTDNNLSIFNSFTAQTATDLAGKINIVTGATGNLGEFDASGNLVDSGFAISGITGSTTDIYVSGMTYIGSTLTLQRTEGLPDLTVSIVTSGASDGVVSGGTLSGTILSLQRTEGLPDVDIELSGLTGSLEGDIQYLSGVTSGNTVAISGLTNDITYISGITDTKLDTAIFNTYTGDTQPVIDAALTGATNGLTASGRDVLLGGTLTQNTSVDGASGFTLSLKNLGGFGLSFTGQSLITDLGSNGGIQYAGDYSANYVDRSLVDKAYVDAIATGLDWKNAALVATTSGETDIDLTGGTFTGVIDGITLADGARVLIKNQDSAKEQNGIYDWDLGTSGFTRSTDFDGTPEGEVTQGATLYVLTGTTNENSAWSLTTPDPITVGVTELNFVLFSQNVSYVAGVGITIIGNTIAFDGANVAGTNLSWSGTQLDVTGVVTDSTFNSYTAQTAAEISYISGVTDQNTTDIQFISGVTSGLTSDISFISGVTDSNTTRIENLESSVSGITGQTYVTEDTFTGYTATTDTRITGIESDITFLSGETDNKLDKVSGATNNNLPIFALSGDSLVDSGIALSAVTGTSSPANEIQLVGTGVTDINTIATTEIVWHIADFSGSSYNWSGGSGIFILEDGDYEVSYHLTAAQVGGGQPRSVGAYIILNNTETLDRTSSATYISGADYKGSLVCPPTIFTLSAGDRLDLAAFRIGGTGSVSTTAFEQVILIKKKGTLV